MAGKKEKLDNYLREKAKEIKTNGSIYNYPTYTISTINADIPAAVKTTNAYG